jgi:hypothetical protein
MTLNVIPNLSGVLSTVGGGLKNLFDFFNFAVHKILHVSKLFQN